MLYEPGPLSPLPAPIAEVSSRAVLAGVVVTSLGRRRARCEWDAFGAEDGAPTWAHKKHNDTGEKAVTIPTRPLALAPYTVGMRKRRASKCDCQWQYETLGS